MNTEKGTMSKGIAALGSGPPIPIGVEDYDFTPRYLDPEKIRLFRSPMGAPRLEILEEICYTRVAVRRILPLSDPDRYISLGIGEEVEIGIIEDPSRLDPKASKSFARSLISDTLHLSFGRFTASRSDLASMIGRLRHRADGSLSPFKDCIRMLGSFHLPDCL